MTGESRETEPFQKALMMETGTVIFPKCLSERFSEKKISQVRKPARPIQRLSHTTFQGFSGNVETKLGGTRNLPSLCAGAVFIFAVLRKEGCHVPHTHCRTYQKIIWQKHNIKRYQSYRRKRRCHFHSRLVRHRKDNASPVLQLSGKTRSRPAYH